MNLLWHRLASAPAEAAAAARKYEKELRRHVLSYYPFGRDQAGGLDHQVGGVYTGYDIGRRGR